MTILIFQCKKRKGSIIVKIFSKEITTLGLLDSPNLLEKKIAPINTTEGTWVRINIRLPTCNRDQRGIKISEAQVVYRTCYDVLLKQGIIILDFLCGFYYLESYGYFFQYETK